MKTHPKREDTGSPALKPVGLAMAAVVAGLGAQAQAAEALAPLEPASRTQAYAIDPTNHPGFEEDADMIVGPSAPVAPFGER
ncbi:MAG: hypothetical protein K2P70_15295 [Hyphomonadaceae bacterium]|nr:hypothetical protein [Hyphomonadaceae bacterium]